MKRLPYILWTTSSLGAAYLLLRLVLVQSGVSYPIFPDAWQFLDPIGLLVSDGPGSGYTLSIHAALTIVLVLCGIQRAKDAGWNPWIGGLLVLPVVRLFVFTALAAIPSARHTDALELPRISLLDRILPRSRGGSAVAAVLLAVLLVIPLGFANVQWLNAYGLALFIGLPFVLGAVSSYLYNYNELRSLRASIGVAFLAVSITLLLLLVLALEGVLCLVMAAPIAYGIAIAGAFIGHALSQSIHGRATAMNLLILVIPTLMAFETAHTGHLPLLKVMTSVRIEAPASAVWRELVAFSRMDEPDELLFHAGISYPMEARIEGTGVGACRYCQFNTGPFIEPITVWDEPHLLAFDVMDDPPPMTELTFYDQIDAPHVEGFFRSRKGQFKLVTASDGSILLEGTTWYTHEIWPTWYWRLWSDAILHRIHQRVLDHIKEEAETSTSE